MSEENVSLFDLLNLAIGTPQKGVVNFSALHTLLHAVLRQLDIREVKTRWRDNPPDKALVGVTAPKEDHHTEEEQHRVQRDIPAAEREAQHGNEQRERIASSSSPTTSSGPAADGQWRLRSRIQTCEDGVSKAMKLIEELHSQKDNLKEKMKELHHQQKMIGAGQADTVSDVEKCYHRVDALEDTVRSLRDTFQKYPDPEELSQCVTWDVMQSTLLSERENLQKDLVNSEVVDPATYKPFNRNFTAVNTAHSLSTPSSPRLVEDTDWPAAPSSQTISGQISTETRTATGAPSVLSEPTQQIYPKTGPAVAVAPLTRKASTLERYSETVEALRNIGKLKDRFSKLEARVAALEEGKVDQSQLTHLQELITNKGSQDESNNLINQVNLQRALIDSLKSDQEKNVELVNDVQKVIVQLQAECEKLYETTRCLHEDNRQKQSHIEELYKMTQELEEKKADKQMVESEIKADKSALESKVSRLQFDSATEHLNIMFHELLNKVTGQEQDWHKVIDKLSTEMECKLNRIELDSVKKQLEDRWKNIHKKLQAQGAPEHEDAAAIRKQLVDRFHCLSCDRPVVMHTSGQHLVKLPSTPGFPSHKSIRPFTVYALEQFRQHYRSERISEMTDYSRLAVSRSCGGSHTVSTASQRRSGLQYMKHHAQTEVDSVIQSEEIDIIGLDGHIYKGHLNTPAIRNTENKLPTISTKDGMCKTKDKAKCSLSHKPAASPDVGHGASVHHPNSAKSAQCSRPASSSSGRDWPVSTLGCTSQSSVTPTSAAAESNTEPHAGQSLNL